MMIEDLKHGATVYSSNDQVYVEDANDQIKKVLVSAKEVKIESCFNLTPTVLPKREIFSRFG